MLIIRWLLIGVMIVATIYIVMFAGFLLGKSALHRKLDKAMYDAYERAVEKFRTNVNGYSIEFIHGMEEADRAIFKVLHSYTYDEKESDNK